MEYWSDGVMRKDREQEAGCPAARETYIRGAGNLFVRPGRFPT